MLWMEVTMSQQIASTPYQEFVDLESYRFLGDGAARTLKGFFLGPPTSEAPMSRADVEAYGGNAWRKGSPVTITIPQANGANVGVGFKDCTFSDTTAPQSTNGVIPFDACGFIGVFSGSTFVDWGGYDSTLRLNFNVLAAALPWPFTRSLANGLVPFGRVNLGSEFEGWMSGIFQLGTAGVPSPDVVSVQGILSGYPVTVASKTRPVPFIPVVDAGAYAALDVLFDRTLVSSPQPMAGVDMSSLLVGLEVTDLSYNTAADMDVFLLNADVTIGTKNSPFGMADADEAAVKARILVPASAWKDYGAFRKAILGANNLDLNTIEPISGSANIYAAAMTYGTPTYAATNALKFNFKFADGR